VLEEYVIRRQQVLLFDLLQAHFDLDKLVLSVDKLLADLCVTQTEHSTHLLRGQPLIQHHPDLFQLEAEPLQRQDPVQPGQLAGRVIAVAGGPIHLDRFQEAKLIVVAQGRNRNLHQL
jgi:hypothetical protein